MSGLRVAAALAFGRIRTRPSRGLLAATGVAIAVAIVCGTAGVQRVAGDLALRRSIEAMPAGERTFVASLSHPLGDRLAAVDAMVRSGLAGLSHAPVRREVLYRELADGHGAAFWLAGLDDLGSAVDLAAGRLPAPCGPSRCEVLAVGGDAPALDPASGLRIVGRGSVVEPTLLSGTFSPGAGATVLIANGADGVAGLEGFSAIQRSYGWVSAIEPHGFRLADVRRLLARAAATRNAFTLAETTLTLTAPDPALARAADRAAIATRRLALVGGAGAALLGAFAIVVAIGRRRDHRALVALLERRGASRPASYAFTLVEAAWPAIVGVVVGIAVAVASVAYVANRAGLPAQAILGASAPDLGGAVLAAVIVATIAIAVTLRVPTGRGSRTLELVALAALIAALLAASRGDSDPSSLLDRSDPLLTALPALAALVAGLVAVRALAPALQIFERRLARQAITARLALLGPLRRPLRASSTAGFVAAALTLAILAVSYAATLDRGARDQAAFAVPLDLTADVRAAAIRSLPGGAGAYAVLRQAAVIRSAGEAGEPVALIGLAPDAVRAFRGWRGDYAATSPGRLADAIAWKGRAPAGVAIPAGAKRLAVVVDGDAANLEPALEIRLADGRTRVVPAVPAVAVDELGSGAAIVGLQFAESQQAGSSTQHHLGEGSTAVAATEGRVRVRGFRTDAGTQIVPDWTRWVAADGATVAVVGDALEIRLRVLGRPARVRLRQPTDAGLDVIADERSASSAQGGALAITVGSGQVVRGRVVATARRLPGVGARFVIADVAALAVALDALAPGTGTPRESWVLTPDRSAAGAVADRIRQLVPGAIVVGRHERQKLLESDPLARSAVGLLVAGAIAAFVAALVAVALGVIGDRSDESGELAALEADGVGPATLRRVLVLRTAAIVAVGVPIGTVAGIAVGQAVTSLIAVTATSATPVPPLVAGAGAWQWLALALAAVVGALVAGALAAAPGFREPTPPRPEGGLR